MPHHVQALTSSLTLQIISPAHQLGQLLLRALLLSPCWVLQKPSVRKAAQSEANQQLAAALQTNKELRDEVSKLKEALAAAALLPQKPAGGYSPSLNNTVCQSRGLFWHLMLAWHTQTARRSLCTPAEWSKRSYQSDEDCASV